MFRKLRVNTQERAMSVDINRLQSFAVRGFAEAFRRMLIDSTDQADLSYPETTTQENPLAAEIVRGLLVRPAVGSLNLSIDAGVIFLVDPTTSGADDSICWPVDDAGVSTPGALTMTGNAAGSTRIDVIECRLHATPTVVTDNRDIFDPTTGLFSATSVTKEVAPRLEYRVRMGTAGSGFPGTAAGWLPLAVASVPNGATSNDTITFWDVRPMLEDRMDGPTLFTRQTATMLSRPTYVLDDRTDTNAVRMIGEVSGAVNGRRVGGVMRRGTPGTDADYVDLRHADNLASGFSFPSSALYYAYLLFPFGLPRWARYADGGTRIPRAPFGIPVVTSVAPTHGGKPSAAINLPTSTGLSGSSSTGVCVVASRTETTTPRGGMHDGTVFFRREVGTAFAATTGALSGGSWTLTEGTAYPANAKALHVILRVSVSVKAATVVQMDGLSSYLRIAGPGLVQAHVPMTRQTATNHSAGDMTYQFQVQVRIPLYPRFPAAGGNTVVSWDWNITKLAGTGTDPTYNSANMDILGWEF